MIWVLTREINQYNQDGEYYVTYFINKPTIQELAKYLGIYGEYAKHILEVGGRLDIENEWYYLRQQ